MTRAASVNALVLRRMLLLACGDGRVAKRDEATVVETRGHIAVVSWALGGDGCEFLNARLLSVGILVWDDASNGDAASEAKSAGEHGHSSLSLKPRLSP